MKKFGILFMLLFTLTVSAQSDFEIASEFMSKKGVKLAPNERSLTRGTDVPYSIFNGAEDKGFCIVVNGKVVGYDTTNTINKEDLPCGLNELLDTYSKTVTPIKTRGSNDYIPDWWEPRTVEPVEPLLTTHWAQSSPYNDMLEKKSGICTLVAWCQILHYFGIPRLFGKNDEKVGDTIYIHIIDSIGDIWAHTDNVEEAIIFDSIPVPLVSFNHDLILDNYYGHGSAEERHEVAKLFYYFSLVQSGKGFTYQAGNEVVYDSHAGRWENYLGFHKEGNYYEKEGEEKGLYYYYDKYLEQKYPFWECGANHAYVVDGRDSEGRYHINFGWGGNSDGYYVFPNTKEQAEIYKNDNRKNTYINCNPTCIPILVYPIKFSWSPTSNINTCNNKISKENSSVYNLQGRKVGNSLDGLSKGVYIQNGKKVIK